MKLRLCSTALGLALSALAATPSFATTITFDGVPDGTAINNHYAGVTFSCFSSQSPSACGSANVYARSIPVQYYSPSNVVSTSRSGFPYQQDNLTGAIKVAFATAQSSVSIEAHPSEAPEGFGTPGYAYLQAYDSNLHLLGEVDDSTLNVYSPLSLNFSGQISYLLIGDVEGQFPTLSLFDDLCYSAGSGTCGGGGPVPPTSTPEPNSVLLLGTGTIACLGLLGKRHFFSA